MPKYRVQQFHQSEDEFLELGGLQTLDLTTDEETTLLEHDGEITWVETRRGYFALASEEPVDE